MADKLDNVFQAYADTVRSKLQPRSEELQSRGPLRLLVNKSVELATVVEELEKEREFLYDFRPHLVHGKQFDKQVYVGQLRQARSLARLTLLWFLGFLSDQASESIGTREDILTLLDLESDSRVRLSRAIAKLPDQVPYVPAWLEKHQGRSPH